MTKNLFTALVLVLLLDQANAHVFTSNSLIGPNELNYENQSIEVRNCELTIGGEHVFQSLHVVGTGKVTVLASHGDADRRVNLNVAGDVEVDANAAISVSASGYPSASGPGAGEAGAGAGHGGVGGMPYNPYGTSAGGFAYGDLLVPTTFGSGGSNGYNATGGSGGGAIRLTVGGTLKVNGMVAADGGNGGVNMQGGSAGGGSGGSVLLTTGSLAGNGVISANGGTSPADGGAGGAGGRIAIYTTVNDFAGTLSARGGSGAMYGSGGAGTVYTQTGSQTGHLLVDNANVLRGAATPISSPVSFGITLANGAIAYPTSALEIASLTIRPNSKLVPLPTQSRIDLTVQNGVIIEATGRMDASGSGYGPGIGPGAGDSATGGGGGHGGEGGRASSLTVGGGAYDSFLTPAEPGSGGGNAYASLGGAGGGIIRMIVGGTLQVDGQLAANGANAVAGPSGGGGGGGGLHLTVAALSGSGTITADGGSSVGQGYGYGGGGAGGRIAIYANTRTFSGNLSAFPGTGQAQPGGAGTIYLKLNTQEIGDLRVDANNIVGAFTPLTSPEACRVVIANRARTYAQAALTLQSLHLTGNSQLSHLNSRPNLALTVKAGLVVDAGSAITATGMGYGGANGPGAGGSGGGGGGHGGSGGFVLAGGAGGPAYDSATEPVLWGSGGGAGHASSGGTGGGAIRLIVGGTFELNGELSADGLSGGIHGGGGAGGSIWVTADTLAGAGNIWARGAASINGGGGGGGRIVLAVDHRGTFSSNPMASGGTGEAAGGDGTVQQIPRTIPSLTLTHEGSSIKFNWPSVDGLNYQLQSSPTLEVDSWHNEGTPQIGNGMPIIQNLPIVSGASRFYRLKVSN